MVRVWRECCCESNLRFARLGAGAAAALDPAVLVDLEILAIWHVLARYGRQVEREIHPCQIHVIPNLVTAETCNTQFSHCSLDM